MIPNACKFTGVSSVRNRKNPIEYKPLKATMNSQKSSISTSRSSPKKIKLEDKS